ncbi:hypothetical protein HK405_008582 [Cladochytrium tenue]|nr:hypothetical protein HK405_008582 [Cladochytrium tenue]
MANPLHVLDHLAEAHSLVVASPEQVMPFLDRYLHAWASRLAAKDRDDATSSESAMKIVLDPASNEQDSALRLLLQRQKLDEMLARQERERQEEALQPRPCLFCKTVSENRHELFRHMFDDHGFSIGLPDNLVEVNEFLDAVAAKLTRLQCIYCEKTFTTSAVLRKHMRKKKHFKINPRNQEYDRYYIINYLEPGKNWESYQDEQYESEEDRDANDWEDWSEADDSFRTMCLFDEDVFETASDAVDHMKAAHGFDLSEIRKSRGLDFYAVIRLVNFVRLKTAHGTCFSCGAAFETMDELADHFRCTDHAALVPGPADPLWADPMYLFPTFDDDPLLTWDPEVDDEGDGTPAM